MFDYQFEWKNPQAGKVFVTGNFDNWQQVNELEKQPDGTFKKVIPLPSSEEKILYKFVVDGNWVIDNSMPVEEDGRGNQNNYINIPVENLGTIAAAAEGNFVQNKDQEEEDILKREEEERIQKQKEEEERLKREEEEKKLKKEQEKLANEKKLKKKKFNDNKKVLNDDSGLRERSKASPKSKEVSKSPSLKEDLKFNESATKYAIYVLTTLSIVASLVYLFILFNSKINN